MARVVSRRTADAAQLAAMLRPRTHPVLERAAGPGRFEAAEGPVSTYHRSVEHEPAADGAAVEVTETVEFRLAIPYFAWLLLVPVRRALRRPPWQARPWWLPGARFDARASSMLATLCAVSVVSGYLNTLFSQTVAFAADEFHASNQAQGAAGGVVRVGGMLAVIVAARADRAGRRGGVITAATAGCLLAAGGAAAPSLLWLSAGQVLARTFATALAIIVLVMAAEEVPAGARALAVSLLAMSSALGAGVCVMALRLADLGVRAWRLTYLIPLLGLLLVPGVARRLPESRRFATRSRDVAIRGHGRRLWLLAASALLANLFAAPSSQFFNRYLRQERHYSGGGIALLTIGSGTPAGLGIVVGGRLADLWGRRLVASVALTVGTVLAVAAYFSAGVALWAWSVSSSVVLAATVPALGVYGPELFPTAIRGRSNGLIGLVGLAGSAIGLLATGIVADRVGRVGPAMALMGAGPVLLAVLVLAAYPETAGLELEELNPEDPAPE